MSNDEILREFLLETHENLALLDSDLIQLEKHPENSSTLAQVFRTLHSIKGTAGFMGLVKLQAVAHSAENLLSRLRAGQLEFNQPIGSALLRVVDATREILARIEATGTEGDGDYRSLSAELDRLRESHGQASRGQTEVAEGKPINPSMDESDSGEKWSQTMVMPAEGFDVAVPGTSAGSKVAESAAGSASVTAAVPDLCSQLPGVSDEPKESRSLVAERSIRVDVGLLDSLMTQVGELVLARNQILQYQSHQDDDFQGAVQRLNQLTSSLQSSVMRTRMQPVGVVLNKFPRIIRDLAIACGKQVRFRLEGEETELDRTLLEAIRDPLTHLVRNAVDHGIETPAARTAAGKPTEGHLRMLAYHEGGKVVIEITDDGCGIDTQKVREKAIANRLITQEAAVGMSAQELTRLIFLPGFSTADRVTQFSGRGVGMDVVRTNIERIGGAIEIDSALGLGTTIRIRIPLTLAIIPALVVNSGGERFAIPQSCLQELIWLGGESQGIEWVQALPVFRLRGKLLPLVFLAAQLCLEPTSNESESFVVVVKVEEVSFGIVVEEIRDTEEIVVKPLQRQLSQVTTFAGAAIMGDGRVALVLDILGLAQRSGLIGGVKSQLYREENAVDPGAEEDLPPILLFLSARGERMALPLSQVERLEEFAAEQFEIVGGRQMIQYRGAVLPLVDVSEQLQRMQSCEGEFSPGDAAIAASGPLSATPDRPESGSGEPPATVQGIVFNDGESRVGLLVGRVLEIVQQRPVGISESQRAGVMFNAILLGQVTEFIDTASVVGTALRASSTEEVKYGR